jgi:branched-subunit amino acid aminotransferase/4-amino-4-deoxychorismate lyase
LGEFKTQSLHKLSEITEEPCRANSRKLLQLIPTIRQAAGFVGKPHRVRLLVARDGAVEIQTMPFVSIESPQPVRVKLAAAPVSSAEIFLYHKTTQRQINEAARQSCQECDDGLLWNECGELTESCIANIVVEMDGNLLTPPVDSGLLPGVFRAWLLDQGKSGSGQSK